LNYYYCYYYRIFINRACSISLRHILILSSYLYVSLTSGFFLLSFRTRISHGFLVSSRVLQRMPLPRHPPLFNMWQSFAYYAAPHVIFSIFPVVPFSLWHAYRSMQRCQRQCPRFTCLWEQEVKTALFKPLVQYCIIPNHSWKLQSLSRDFDMHEGQAEQTPLHFYFRIF
jgi:hypothetical protein